MNNNLHNLLKKEIRNYPQLKLQDVYKLYYQDYFGPGHFLSSRQQALNNLNTELKNYSSPAGNFPALLSIRGYNDFIRLDLGWVLKGYLMSKELADMFYKSTLVQLNQPLNWEEHWQEIIRLVSQENIVVTHQEIKQLQQKAKQQVDVHHSESYRQLYKPHYRLIDRNIWLNYVLMRKV